VKLIIGLGNPGAEYAHTRHNFGWSVLDYLAQQFQASAWHHKPKFQAEIAEAELDGEKILLVKPQTFYNLSGETARSLRDFYHLSNADILVIHDDMDLRVGQLRARRGGADAGNNGIKSLNQHLGADFARLRIGSGVTSNANGLTKPESDQADYVLSRPTADELAILRQFEPVIFQIVCDFARGEFTETTYRV
jgi:PTH1 family peptidyl-tRNA hydrolase